MDISDIPLTDSTSVGTPPADTPTANISPDDTPVNIISPDNISNRGSLPIFADCSQKTSANLLSDPTSFDHKLLSPDDNISPTRIDRKLPLYYTPSVSKNRTAYSFEVNLSRPVEGRKGAYYLDLDPISEDTTYHSLPIDPDPSINRLSSPSNSVVGSPTSIVNNTEEHRLLDDSKQEQLMAPYDPVLTEFECYPELFKKEAKIYMIGDNGIQFFNDTHDSHKDKALIMLNNQMQFIHCDKLVIDNSVNNQKIITLVDDQNRPVNVTSAKFRVRKLEVSNDVVVDIRDTKDTKVSGQESDRRLVFRCVSMCRTVMEAMECVDKTRSIICGVVTIIMLIGLIVGIPRLEE